MSALGVLVHPDGVVEVKRFAMTLESIQQAVGGLIEGISDPDPSWFAYCDEEGKLKDLDVNIKATALARQLGWRSRDIISGPVLFVGPPDERGNDTDAPESLIRRIEEIPPR